MSFQSIKTFWIFSYMSAYCIFCNMLCVCLIVNECHKVISIETKTYAETRHLTCCYSWLCGFNRENKICYTDSNVNSLECYTYQNLMIHLSCNKIGDEATPMCSLLIRNTNTIFRWYYIHLQKILEKLRKLRKVCNYKRNFNEIYHEKLHYNCVQQLPSLRLET